MEIKFTDGIGANRYAFCVSGEGERIKLVEHFPGTKHACATAIMVDDRGMPIGGADTIFGSVEQAVAALGLRQEVSA